MQRSALHRTGLQSLLLAGGLSACLAGNSVSGQARPNVLIFYTDDQGTLDANCYGSTDLRTPAIDSLAASGVRFTHGPIRFFCLADLQWGNSHRTEM